MRTTLALLRQRAFPETAILKRALVLVQMIFTLLQSNRLFKNLQSFLNSFSRKPRGCFHFI